MDMEQNPDDVQVCEVSKGKEPSLQDTEENSDYELMGDDDDLIEEDDDDLIGDDDDYLYEDGGSAFQYEFMDNMPTGVETEFAMFPNSSNQSLGPSNSDSKSSGGVSLSSKFKAFLPALSGSALKNMYHGAGAPKPHLQSSRVSSLSPSESIFSGSGSIKESWTLNNTVTQIHGTRLESIELFKKFDIVEDCSDHFYLKNVYCVKQQPKKWAKRIQNEWRILEKDLPDKQIFVRVYESRMDLLRAAIVGAEGTPYHNGLFFFDVFFPSNYPNVPPHVHYHSGGLRINPNLYNCGKVCLSLLGTWYGDNAQENWVPGVSTMLQVLLSIQALILNADPYFNEPGYESNKGSKAGKRQCFEYNENIYIYSLRTMVFSVRRPPKHFEDLVATHFCHSSRDILRECRSCLERDKVGWPVGDEQILLSSQFKRQLSTILSLLVNLFTMLGAKDLDEFLNLAAKWRQERLSSVA